MTVMNSLAWKMNGSISNRKSKAGEGRTAEARAEESRDRLPEAHEQLREADRRDHQDQPRRAGEAPDHEELHRCPSTAATTSANGTATQ